MVYINILNQVYIFDCVTEYWSDCLLDVHPGIFLNLRRQLLQSVLNLQYSPLFHLPLCLSSAHP